MVCFLFLDTRYHAIYLVWLDLRTSIVRLAAVSTAVQRYQAVQLIQYWLLDPSPQALPKVRIPNTWFRILIRKLEWVSKQWKLYNWETSSLQLSCPLGRPEEFLGKRPIRKRGQTNNSKLPNEMPPKPYPTWILLHLAPRPHPQGAILSYCRRPTKKPWTYAHEKLEAKKNCSWNRKRLLVRNWLRRWRSGHLVVCACD